jgi:hypothetical protein
MAGNTCARSGRSASTPRRCTGPSPTSRRPTSAGANSSDQHGRRWGSDDGSTTPPPQPDPPSSDLPPLMPWWGDWQPPVGALPRRWTCWSTGSLRQAAQLAGDGLRLAVEQHVAGATALARELAEDLRGQFDPGATTLASELDAVCGDNTAPDLTPVPVELGELSMHPDSGDDLGGGRLRLSRRVHPARSRPPAALTSATSTDERAARRWGTSSPGRPASSVDSWCSGCWPSAPARSTAWSARDHRPGSTPSSASGVPPSVG